MWLDRGSSGTPYAAWVVWCQEGFDRVHRQINQLQADWPSPLAVLQLALSLLSLPMQAWSGPGCFHQTAACGAQPQPELSTPTS